MKPLSKRIGFLTVVQEREANRHRDEQRRLAEEEEYMILKERHHRVDEQNHQAHQPEHYQPPAPRQLWQQEKILRYRQRGKDEQKEFGRKVVEHYQSTTERERRKAPPAPSRIHDHPRSQTSVIFSSQCSDAAADSVSQSLGLTGTVLYIRDHCAFLVTSMVVCHANRISPQLLEDDGGH